MPKFVIQLWVSLPQKLLPPRGALDWDSWHSLVEGDRKGMIYCLRFHSLPSAQLCLSCTWSWVMGGAIYEVSKGNRRLQGTPLTQL